MSYETKALIELTVEEVVTLFENINVKLPADCSLDGSDLSLLETKEELTELGFPVLRAKRVFSDITKFQEEGVPLSLIERRDATAAVVSTTQVPLHVVFMVLLLLLLLLLLSSLLFFFFFLVYVFFFCKCLCFDIQGTDCCKARTLSTAIVTKVTGNRCVPCSLLGERRFGSKQSCPGIPNE